MKQLRSLLVLLMALIIAPVALAQDAPLRQTDKWGQDYLDREADPAVLFGTLPNGLRYAIMKNDTPKGAVAMRMLIGSGSLKERDDELGLAHFLEHMAFRGSTNVADGEVVRMLERQGLRFGPDTNASTSHERTLYMFNFPRASAEALETGFTLFREIGQRLTLDPAKVEAETGVILSEERLRDTPSFKAAKANIELLMQGTLAPRRWAIGTLESIRDATADKLRRYYEANYRPDNATIVVVGAIDPAAVEAQIKAGFADWKPAGPADTYDPGTPMPTVAASEVVGDGVPDQLSLNWVGPVDRRAETAALDREKLDRSIGLLALNNRLSDRALQPGSPFVAVQANTVDSLLDTVSLTTLAVQADPSKWQEALDSAVEELRLMLRDGLTEEDFQRATTSLLTRFEATASAAETRRNEALADGLVATADSGGIFTSPAQDLAFVKDALAQTDPARATAALRAQFTDARPLIFRAAHADPATPAVLEEALTAAFAQPLPAATQQSAVSWPYDDFGTPGAVVDRREDAALGATIVTFANGTRLIAKQTDFQKDRIAIQFGFGTGEAGIPADLTHASWATALYPVGGTAKLTVPDLQRLMQTQGKVGGVRPGFDTRRFVLSGGTRPADLAFEMQLLTAFATDPGFRPEMADQLRSAAPMLRTQVETTPSTVFSRGLAALVNGGDERFNSTPTAEDIDATTPQDIPALLRPQLATPADVTIVGDVSIDEAIRVTAATIGAVSRPARPEEPEVRITMTPGREEPYVFRHGGRADQAMYGLAWQLPDFPSDPALSYVADVTTALIKARLVDTVRETLGLTYSPNAGAVASLELPGLGFLSISAETPPDKFDDMRAAILDVLDNLASQPIDPDELDRARMPLVESAQKSRETNGFWVQNLATVLRDARARDFVLQTPERLGAVTADQVQALLNSYVIGKTPITAIAIAR